MRIVWIDFHHPAEAVRLVRRGVDAEPFIHFVPAVRVVAPADTVTFFQRVHLCFFYENIGPVLFTRQIGAPRRKSVGTVLHGAENDFAFRIVNCLHQWVMQRRTGDFHRRVNGDAACER